MIAFLTAYTHEMEDPQKAAEEVLDKLDLEHKQRKNSTALVFCHSAFIEQGVMQAVCEKLPVETLGCTSQYFALPEAADEVLLAVIVLTSDDVEFAAGISGPLDETNVDERIGELYRETAARLSGQPSLILSLQPLMINLSGDIMAAALDRACGDIPVFGTCAVDIGIESRNPQTIYRGAAYRDRLAVLFMHGQVKPRFFSAIFSEKTGFTQDAVITGAEGCRITTINNVPAASFFEKLGIVQADINSVLYAIPLVIDYHDGKDAQISVIRAIGPAGSLICSTNILTGGVLDIGSISTDYVLETARTLAQSVRSADGGAGLFIFSCFSRIVALGGDPMAEINVIKSELAGFPAPYLFFYSGGELCPYPSKNGGMENRFHQYALAACLL